MHEYRIAFPVAIDRPGVQGDPVPATMRKYQMQGTPTLLLIDRVGRLRRQVFGRMTDLQFGAEIMALIGEAGPNLKTASDKGGSSDCGPGGCPID